MTTKSPLTESAISNQIRTKLRTEVMDGTTSLHKAAEVLSELGYIFSHNNEEETRSFLGLRLYNVSNAPRSFAMFLIAMNIPFSYRDNSLSIEAEHLKIRIPTTEAFFSYCFANGVRQNDLAGVTITII